MPVSGLVWNGGVIETEVLCGNRLEVVINPQEQGLV